MMSIKVLCIEPSPNIARLFQRELEDAGHQVDVVSTIQEGSELLKEGPYKVVVVEPLTKDGIFHRNCVTALMELAPDATLLPLTSAPVKLQTEINGVEPVPKSSDMAERVLEVVERARRELAEEEVVSSGGEEGAVERLLGIYAKLLTNLPESSVSYPQNYDDVATNLIRLRDETWSDIARTKEEAYGVVAETVVTKFSDALKKVYSRKIGIDQEDKTIHEFLRSCAIRAADKFLLQHHLYHMLIGSSVEPDKQKKFFDFPKELALEPEIEESFQKLDIALLSEEEGIDGLIRNYIIGLQRRYGLI